MTSRQHWVDFADYRKPGAKGMARITLVYGPINSRRRGFSLGVNLFPGTSVCSFNCVYCLRGGAQLHLGYLRPGETVVGPADIRAALDKALRELGDSARSLRAVDLSGNGEPTLHPDFSSIAKAVYELVRVEWGIPASIGLFTNSTRLCSPRVVEGLQYIDHIEAKLDVASEEGFEEINEPVRGLRLAAVVDCISKVRGRFSGELAIQVMLLDYKGLANYKPPEAEWLVELLARLEPDVVHLYTTYAPTRLREARRAPARAMEALAVLLRERGLRVEVYPE